MTHLNNKNNNNIPTATAMTIISVLAIVIILASTSIVTPAAATSTTTIAAEGNTNTASSVLSSAIKLSSQPIYQERSPPGTEAPINETHGMLTFSGNGTLTLPNSTQTINTTSKGTAVISFATFSGYGKETITAANGERATVTLYEIVQFNNPAAAPEGGGKGIITAIFQTNSTGELAPLNGMIVAGIDDMTPDGESHTTLWRWESGIPLSPLQPNSTSGTNATDPLSFPSG